MVQTAVKCIFWPSLYLRGGCFAVGLLLTLLVCLISPLSAAEKETAAGEARVLRFVTYAAERPTEELSKMAPFQQHLEAALRAKGFPVTINLRIFSTYGDAQDAIASGDFDFARIGPASYVLARDQKAPVRLLVVESHNGKPVFQGVIFTRRDSLVNSLGDLRGKRFAFGEQTSTTGRYLAQAALLQAGLKASDLAGFEFLGRHDKVALAVAAGAFDAGATNERTVDKYADRGLRKVHLFVSPTQPWVVNTKLDRRITEALRLALLHIDMDALKYIDRDGFLPGREEDFDALRKAMRLAEQFAGK
jgi:phosphonate transport system substrate-binding protein